MLTADRLRALTGAPDTVSDELLQFILDSVEEIICNYCNAEALPEGLTHTAYRMAVDMYRAEQYGASSMDGGAGSGPAQSVKVGDTTVIFRDTSSGKDYEAWLASVMHNYTAALNRYRRLKHPCCR